MRFIKITFIIFVFNAIGLSQTYQSLYFNYSGIHQFKVQKFNFDSRNHLLYQPIGFSGAPCIIDPEGGNTYKVNTRTLAIYLPFNNILERFVCSDLFFETCWTEPFDIICISQNDSNFILGYRQIDAVPGVGNCTIQSMISILSYDGGITSFFSMPQGLILKAIETDPVDDNIIYVSSESSIYKSTDRGSTFNIISQTANLKNILRVSSFNNSYVFVSDTLGMLVSTNSGINFSRLSVPRLRQLYFYENKPVVYGAGNGVFKSTNNGLNWIQLSSINASCIEINPDDSSIIYIGTDLNGVYRSVNGGQTFNHSDINFPVSNKILGLSKDPGSADSIIVCTYTGIYKVWDLQTAISEVTNAIPEKYSLNQNYPNPFNPSTTITFSNIKSQNIKLTVYDLSGKEIQTLADQEFPAGTYRIMFDGSQLSSGMYFYKLISDEFTESKRMMLIK